MNKADELVKLIKSSNFVYICGNGGSACNAEHFAEDLLSKGIKALALTPIGSVTAIANDIAYQFVFSRQLATLANKNDLLITLSCSGNSLNIIQAQSKARDIGIKIFTFPTNQETGLITPLTENKHLELIHEVYLKL